MKESRLGKELKVFLLYLNSYRLRESMIDGCGPSMIQTIEAVEMVVPYLKDRPRP